MPFMNVQRSGNLEWIFHSQEYCRYMIPSTSWYIRFGEKPQCGIKKTTKAREGCPLYRYLLRILFGSCTKDIHYRWGRPRWRHSSTANICFQIWGRWCPQPPTPQICAHQKSKNWRRSPCSVYCKPSPKNSRQLEMEYMKRWGGGTPSDQIKTQTCQKLYLRTTITIVQEDPGNGSLSKYENRSPLHRKKSSPHEWQ